MAEVHDAEAQTPSIKDHPKILSNLKDHLHNFDNKNLKNVESQHKVVLPTAESEFLPCHQPVRLPRSMLSNSIPSIH